MDALVDAPVPVELAHLDRLAKDAFEAPDDVPFGPMTPPPHSSRFGPQLVHTQPWTCQWGAVGWHGRRDSEPVEVDGRGPRRSL